MHKKHLRCQLVRECGGGTRLYWDRRQVEKMAAARLPLAEKVPGKFVDSVAAAAMLNVGRSSLYRYGKRKWLHPYRVRVMTAQGSRIHIYYRRDELIKLRFKLNALHMRLAEMRELLSGMGEESAEERD